MTITLDELKTRHQKMWALGDYAAVADEVVGGLGPVVGGLGPVVVDAAGLR